MTWRAILDRHYPLEDMLAIAQQWRGRRVIGGGDVSFGEMDAVVRQCSLTSNHPVLTARGLHSSTFRLIISAFCGIRWVVHAVLVTKPV